MQVYTLSFWLCQKSESVGMHTRRLVNHKKKPTPGGSATVSRGGDHVSDIAL